MRQTVPSPGTTHAAVEPNPWARRARLTFAPASPVNVGALGTACTGIWSLAFCARARIAKAAVWSADGAVGICARWPVSYCVGDTAVPPVVAAIASPAPAAVAINNVVITSARRVRRSFRCVSFLVCIEPPREVVRVEGAVVVYERVARLSAARRAAVHFVGWRSVGVARRTQPRGGARV